MFLVRPARHDRDRRDHDSSVPRNQLLWAAVSETQNPKDLQRFVEELVKESVKELHKQGLARGVPK